jgi:hypothetical protein
MNDRAVSEVISYVLVFSLIIATIGIVSVVGFAGLEDRRNAEQVDNTERAFDVFSYNMEDSYERGAPSRATEMRLSGGTLLYGDRVNITVEESGGGQNVTARPRPLIYTSDDTSIVYTAGAIIRTDRGSARMMDGPPFYFDADRIMLPLIETSRPADQSAAGGERTLRVTSSLRQVNETTPSALQTPSGNVTITVESPRADAWERYFEKRAADPDLDAEVTRLGSTEVRLEVDTARVSAPRYRIRLRFVG